MATTSYSPTYATQPTGMLAQPAYDVAVVNPSAAQTVTPATREVNPNELTSTQLDNILSSGSPLMQRAASLGRQTAASRGLLNSSLAAGAAQTSMIDAATPIAQANAGAYETAAGQNLANTQQANIQNAQTDYNRETANAAAVTAANQQGAANLQAKNQLEETYNLQDAQLKLQQQIASEQMTQAQGNAEKTAYTNATTGLMNNYLNGWFNIQQSQMTPDEKTAALNEYNATIRTWQDVINTAYSSMPEWEQQWGVTLQ